MSTERHADRPANSAREWGFVLGVAAVVLLAHPLYLWTGLGSDPDAMLLAGLVRPVLTLFGGFLFAYAALVAHRDSWRPVTPLAALLFPVIASAAVVGLQWYDEAVLGLVGLQPLDNNPVLLAAFSLVFLIGGSLVRRERWDAVTAFAAGCLAVFLLGVVLDGTRPPIALASGIALGAAGTALGGLGYGLTAPS